MTSVEEATPILNSCSIDAITIIPSAMAIVNSSSENPPCRFGSCMFGVLLLVSPIRRNVGDRRICAGFSHPRFDVLYVDLHLFQVRIRGSIREQDVRDG